MAILNKNFFIIISGFLAGRSFRTFYDWENIKLDMILSADTDITLRYFIKKPNAALVPENFERNLTFFCTFISIAGEQETSLSTFAKFIYL